MKSEINWERLFRFNVFSRIQSSSTAKERKVSTVFLKSRLNLTPICTLSFAATVQWKPQCSDQSHKEVGRTSKLRTAPVDPGFQPATFFLWGDSAAAPLKGVQQPGDHFISCWLFLGQEQNKWHFATSIYQTNTYSGHYYFHISHIVGYILYWLTMLFTGL